MIGLTQTRDTAVPPGYWHDTERQLAISNHRDRLAARETNAAFALVNAVPFGWLPEPSQVAS